MFNLKLKKFLHAGFTLPEIMVGGVILAGLGLAGARMFKDQRQSQTKVDDEQALIVFHQMLTKILQDENACNSTLKAAWNYNPTQMASFDVDDILDCPTCSSTGVDYNALTVTTAPTNYREGTWVNAGIKTWMLLDISWKSVSAGTGPAVLTVTYRQDPRQDGIWAGSRAVNVKQVSKDINLMLRFTQATAPTDRLFKECIAGKQSSINNLQNDICGSMTQVTSTGNIMYWDDATQGCVSIGVTGPAVKVCTDNNMVIDGVNADGTVRCRSITRGVIPATDLSDPVSCLPGVAIRMEFDSVTRRLKAKCD